MSILSTPRQDPSALQNKVAFVLSAITFFALYSILNAALSRLGLPTIMYGEDDPDGYVSDGGAYILIASLMLSWRLYHSTRTLSLSGQLPWKDQATWIFSFVGITLWSVLSAVLFKASSPQWLSVPIEFAAAVGLFFGLRSVYTRMWLDRETPGPISVNHVNAS